MLKKTVAVMSVAALAAGVVALPAAAASTDTPTQIAACNPCSAKPKLESKLFLMTIVSRGVINYFIPNPSSTILLTE